MVSPDRGTREKHFTISHSGQIAIVATAIALEESAAMFVTDDIGTETRGRVAAVGAATIRLIVDGDEREWVAARIWQVARRGDSLKNGTMIGLTVGAVIGGIGGAAWASLLSNEGHDAGGAFLFLLGVGAGGGAGIGAGFDALVRGRTVISERASNVTVVPVVTDGGRAVQLSIRF